MTTPMVERVARAISDRTGCGLDDWTAWVEEALAAIEAYEAALKDEGFRVVKPPPHHGIMFAHLGTQTGTAINEGK